MTRPISCLGPKEYHDCAVVWSGFFWNVLVMPGGQMLGSQGPGSKAQEPKYCDEVRSGYDKTGVCE